jgi:cell division protein FtsL
MLPLCAGVLAVIEIVFINQYAGTGHTIYAIDSAINSLTYENTVLEQRVASASSLMTIAAKAKDMGFSEPAKSQYLTVTLEEQPVALHNPQ